ncbi:Orn/DAP/Arg decarboxylase 2 [Parvibaculum lavamentivorans DS-1]|uniref:ornithine decarboxylase n=1 Tax=Parvibaculum lavamentivorans (strain DS-1 / DSM 13023 / NCIMB 13966) TaxID=402881 RepID=A7HY56_PARL1|nr:type III PLP-dependent enzyme [Parvibaculum lavamentivorans]ABS64839.1 Orn/DAP/Arg decarboxylase 2 [Parvibaculum lavamentivorans DS-1]
MFASEQGRRARSRISMKSAAKSVPATKPGAPVKSGPRRKPRLRLVPKAAELPLDRGGLPPKIARYLATADLPSPCLVVDVDIVAHNFGELASSLPDARIFYAVKANPADEIVSRLAGLGSSFDTASMGEIDLCLSHGVSADRLSFGNTIKKERDIAAAYAKGVRMFAFDSTAELDKIARVAPGSKVYCRVLMECEGAEWPLSRKFGCEPAMAVDLLVRAKALGLDAYGVSFHVGSQQTDLTQYDKALALSLSLFRDLEARGVKLRMVNMGGGFPSRYRTDVPSISAYGAAIREALLRHFGDSQPDVIVEPGRGVVGDAGVIQAEVVLVSEKGGDDARRWVYLDAGKFHGLAETMDEAIKYRLLTSRDGGETSPVVLAGPTCDSADILYEKTDYRLPSELEAGDKVWILATGAYTTTYSAVAFNGFPPLASVCI